MKQKLLDFPLQHARLVFVGLAVLTIGLGSAIPWIQVDTDPENMLSERDPARVFHNQTKEEFALHDLIVVGVVNEVEPAGVFNPESLARVHELNERLKSIDGVIARDVLGPSTMDNIEQAGPGAIRFEWLMEQPPKTPEEAIAIKEAALRLPMLRGTVVSEDGKSIALYVPIESKDQSHRISEEIRATIAGFGDNTDDFYITGLPVAEDTFGVEMFKQMAVSAPLAALVILLLMWWFFRSFALVLSPMIVALTTVTITMGALIASGFTVHIMSSMIPIFLMPIAVVDSVHMLSEFVDNYAKSRDRKAAIKEVVVHLFAPMLYTSLTSAAGFLSLTFTPIPPVRVFGVFVALGIAIAFVLTILFVPAYIAALPEKRLAALLSSKRDETDGGLLGRAVAAVGDKSLRFAKPILVVTVAAIAISAYGITKININDNPVRWFKPSHEIRVADAVLNRELAGTYTAYLIMKQDTDAERQIVDAGDAAVQGASDAVRAKWAELKTESETASREGVTNVSDALVEATSDLVFDTAGEESERWQAVQTALEKAQSASKTFQNPEHLAYIERLQREAEALPLVGKTSSIADVVKTVYRELASGEDKDYRIPESNEGVAQTLLQFQSSHRPNDLWHLVSPDYRESAIWMQLKSGDNQDMMSVKSELDAFLAENPPPDGLRAQWAGLTYLNVVWQDEMVGGMLESLMGAFVIVFIMMVVLFRSPVYGVLAMIPLTITILFTYGLIGLVGKDYDMPVAVLSSLTLGLSVDFAIHFLERARSIQVATGDWKETMALMFQEPGRAITRNAIVIAIGFLPLLAAPLVPYNTVGFLMAAIMAVSSIVTVLLLPSLMMQIQNWLSPRKEKVSKKTEDASASARDQQGANDMKTLSKTSVAAITAAILLSSPTLSAEAGDLKDASEIVNRTNSAQYYTANDGRALVRMKIVDDKGRSQRRQFAVLRRDVKDGADQNYLVVFDQPADVRNTAFLVKKHPNKDDDRWLYLPGLDLVKRIAASDERTSFVGTHFFYEDISGRHPSEDTHQLLETTDTEYVVKSTPKSSKGVEFAHYTLRIDKKTFLPSKIEYVNAQGKVYRRIETVKVEDLQGHPTITRLKVSDLDSGGYTLSDVSNVQYDLGIPDDIFVETSLRNPPQKWLR